MAKSRKIEQKLTAENAEIHTYIKKIKNKKHTRNQRKNVNVPRFRNMHKCI